MLITIKELKDVKYSQIMAVYEESNLRRGRDEYPHLTEALQLMNAEQDYYSYLRDFFRIDGAFCVVWCFEDRYRSALRMEPYRDGYLLTGLETAPNDRGKGYAKSLVSEMLNEYRKFWTLPVYSHIEKTNFPSLTVHEACDFVCIQDFADYIDGTRHNESSTWIYR